MPEDKSHCAYGVLYPLKYYILKSEMLKMTFWLEDEGFTLDM